MPPTTRLYLPLYRRVRELLGQAGLLYAGDCKMAALETRAEIAADGDFYLTRLPMTGEVAAQFAGLGGGGADRRAGGELGRDPRARTSSSAGDTSSSGRNPPWWARRSTPGSSAVQIIRSEALAQSQAAALERRLEKAEAALRGLTPPPGPGRTQFTTGWELERAVAGVLAEHQVEGLLEVSWERRRDQPDQVRRSGPRRSRIVPRRPNGTSATRSRRCGATRRRSNTGWSGWAGRSR